MPTKRCPFCNEELPESANFCPACFQELGDSSAAFVTEKHIAKGKIFFVAGIVLCLMLILLWHLCRIPDTVSDRSDGVTTKPSPGITATPNTTPTFIFTSSPSLMLQTTVPTRTTAPTILPTKTPEPTLAPTPTVAPTPTPTITPTPTSSVNPYTYTVTNNVATITKYNGTETIVYIPEQLGGYRVTAVGNDAFKNNTYIEEVTIPSPIQSIGKYCFSNCINLKSVSMSNTVITLGDGAFSNNPYLSKVRLSDNISILPAYCFTHCSKLTELTLPANLTRMYPQALEYTGIKRLTIPASVVGVNSMGVMPELEYIDVAEGNEVLWSDNGVLYSANPSSSIFYLEKYPAQKKDKSYTVFEGTTTVYISSFYGNPYLEQVTLSPATTRIHRSAFMNCTALKTIKIYDGVSEILENAFYGCFNLTLTVTEGSYAHTYAVENDIPYVLE